MDVIGLAAIDASTVSLVGGKAAGLAELIKSGERVPDGFCLTTAAHRHDVIPDQELAAAYERLGAGPVAVRSSATAEDLPDASFAGQHATVLGVTGFDSLVDAVRTCWDSLHSERAAAYREVNGVDLATVGMAVVVQRMVQPDVAGVLFTANPTTGCRTEMVVDAAPGLGTAVVDGAVVPDHYVLSGHARAADSEGCLDQKQLEELYRVGRRVQEHFGIPQDIEWAIDADGTLWLLQSRPITTLFPLPPDRDLPSPRVYLELGGHFQGVVRPFTPMGIAVVQATATRLAGSSDRIVAIGGRLYADLTDTVRDPAARKWLPKILGADFGPRVRTVVERVLDDPRFAPGPRRKSRRRGSHTAVPRAVLRGTIGVLRAFARPDAARARAFAAVEELRRETAAPRPGTPAERLGFVANLQLDTGKLEPMIWPLLAGVLAATAPAPLLRGIATEAKVASALGGMPYNVTTEMDLALWRLAVNAADHRELLLHTSPDELAARYRAGTLPDIGLGEFLDAYGHRAAAEIDIGVPRWEEDPAPVFAAVANYLRVTDPEQAPDGRFQQAATRAEAMLDELVRRTRWRRPVRGRIAAFFLRRARRLAGLREIGKFAGLYPLREIRRQLLQVGSDLVARGLLERAGDLMFLDLEEAGAAVEHGARHQKLIASRKATFDRELRRRHIPVALLSDGTDVEALAPREATRDGVLTGIPAAPGTVTGPARVIRDPTGAHIEPGEILVAPTTDPGWTPLFLTAGGLVTEVGAPMAHGPTVAREYGIPAVTCVRDATHEITTGQVVTVDGAAGTVSIGR